MSKANHKMRYVNTKFWNDSYIAELDPSEKLLFIYFLTNGHTNISGIYELPLKIVGVETGFDVSMINKILPRLACKINYVDGYVIIKNFIKHQETGSHLTAKGIMNCIRDLDQEFVNKLVSKGLYEITDELLEGAYKGLVSPKDYSNSNSNSKNKESQDDSEEKQEEDEIGGKQIAEIIKAFELVNPACKKFYGNKTQRTACEDLIRQYTYERVIKAVAFLPTSNTNCFWKATTPLQLWNNWKNIENEVITKLKKQKDIADDSMKNALI